jgi:RNA polymerase sigma factor (sigma-70 family)
LNEECEKLLDVLQCQGRLLYALLYRLTLRHDAAEDLLQEMFVKFMSYDRLDCVENVHAYLCRCAINLAFDWRRRRQPTVDIAQVSQTPGQQPGPLSRVIQIEQLEQVFRAMDGLNGSIREVVVLHYIQHEDYETIARQLGKSQHHVRALCSKGLAQLRKRIDRLERQVNHDRV